MLFDVGNKPISATCRLYLSALKELCGDDQNAYDWLVQIIQIALVWDHIVDGDTMDRKRADEAITNVVLQWPVNPFLRNNAPSLVPVMAASVNAWRSGISRDLDYSVYRELPAAVAFIIGGSKRVEAFMPKINMLVQQLRLEDDARDEQEESCYSSPPGGTRGGI